MDISGGGFAGARVDVQDAPNAAGVYASDNGKDRRREVVRDIAVDGKHLSGQEVDEPRELRQARQSISSDLRRRRPAFVWTPSPSDGDAADRMLSPCPRKERENESVVGDADDPHPNRSFRHSLTTNSKSSGTRVGHKREPVESDIPRCRRPGWSSQLNQGPELPTAAVFSSSVETGMGGFNEIKSKRKHRNEAGRRQR